MNQYVLPLYAGNTALSQKWLVAVFFLLCPQIVRAVPALNPDAARSSVSGPVCHTRSSSIAPKQAASRGGLRTISPTIGTANIAVIIVEFPLPVSGANPTSGSSSIQSLANIDTRFNQMKNYFSEVSYGQLTLNFRFFGSSSGSSNGQLTAVNAGALTLSQPMRYYGCGDVGTANNCSGFSVPTVSTTGIGGLVLLRDSLQSLNLAGVLPTTATFQGVFILHAGNGNETSGANGDIWSVFYDSRTIAGLPSNYGINFPLPGGFQDGAVFPDTETSGITSPLGVMCHEFGHMLALPDLYNTNPFVCSGGCPVVGYWDLMDSGAYTGSGANPAHLGAWAKESLQWITPTVITSTGSATLPYSSLNSNAFVRIPVPIGLPQEYFLVEHRSRSSGATYDQNIPGDGLLIWHIDNQLATEQGIFGTYPLINSMNDIYENGYYAVGIKTADGSVISNQNRGSADQPFTPLTRQFFAPQSNNFSNQQTAISLLNIRSVGSSLAFNVINAVPGPTQEILKFSNFPNPAGKGYAHNLGQEYTTFQFQTARPVSDCQLNLYTLSADLVFKVGCEEILTNPTRTEDGKFVYEYDWNLTNQEAKKVASGVYLYLFRIDGSVRKGKVVVIR